MVLCRRITRRDTSNPYRNNMLTLGTMEHGHALLDEVLFYDFMSLSIEFNKRNLEEFVRVNYPTFPGFTSEQFDDLLERWIFGMLARGY